MGALSLRTRAVRIALVSVLVAAVSPAAAVAMAPVHVVLTTPDLAQALTAQPSVAFTTAPPPHTPLIRIDRARRYQRLMGVGAALTDTSAWLLHDQLPPAARGEALRWLFTADGLQLSFLRIPIAASDFTAQRRPYTYDDLPRGRTDANLRHFSIGHDRAYVIPTLRQLLSFNRNLFTLASPWSAPAWMKANHSLDNMDGRGVLLRSAYGPYARYLIRFIQAYRSAGIRVDALTPQNEPGNHTAYPGMNLSADQEASFLTSSLVPALARARLKTSIYGYDWGWSRISVPFARRLERSPARHVLAGVASHCYFGPPTVMSTLHREAPALRQIMSECSPGITPYATSELEISSLRNWASAVALWNLAEDPEGGPVQPPNLGCPACTALITVDERTHKYTPTIDAFQLGQLSAFARTGAQRIGSGHFVTYSYHGPNHNIASAGLDDVALRNPDGSIVLVAFNNASAPIGFAVADGNRYFSYRLDPGATATFTWR